MNNKDLRILKLWQKGFTVEQIACKLGAPENVVRVQEGLTRSGIHFGEGGRRGNDKKE